MSNKELYKNMPYKITRNIDLVDNDVKSTPEIREILNHTYEKVTRKKNSVVGELNDLIKKYPHVPEFKNHLSSIYELQNNLTKAKEITRTIIKEHPDYLFGKLSLANEFMADGEYDKVPGILGNLIDLKDLYPQRNVFHENEVVMFNRTAVRYFMGIKNFDEAESRLVILNDLDSDEVYVEWLTMQLAMQRLEAGMERWKKEKEMARSVNAIAKKIAEPSNEKPLFNHIQIEQLYANSLRINHEIIREILSLPRETLIADLHKVIYDSIIRFKHFSDDEEWNMDRNEFPTHAIFLLTELKSEESLEVILDILRQDEDYFEFWFGDYLNEAIWESLYVLGFNRLNTLKNFMMEPDRWCYAREVISDVVSQIALHHPERKSEVVQWYKEVFTFFVSQKENDRIIDTSLNGFMASDIIDIRAKELIPELTEIYNNQLASDLICGNLEQIIQEMNSPKWSRDTKKELHENIFLKYEYELAERYYYNEDDDDEDDESENEDGQWHYPDAEFENEFDDDRDDGSDVVYVSNPGTTYVKPEPKINRNDPCPCGSGKKYKKCHGIDEL